MQCFGAGKALCCWLCLGDLERVRNGRLFYDREIDDDSLLEKAKHLTALWAFSFFLSFVTVKKRKGISCVCLVVCVKEVFAVFMKNG